MSAQMTPQEIVSELDKHIIGQAAAKKAVAIALRNRWRRQMVAEPLKNEITPKNILMIGPTGVGKTEIARRLAKLANAPFIKIEATKFTEVGYVGRDVETIIRDLADIAVKHAREQAIRDNRVRAEDAAEDRILDALLPPPRQPGFSGENVPATERHDADTRQKFRKMLREGRLDDKEIDIEIAAQAPQVQMFTPNMPGMNDLTEQLQGLFSNMGGGRKKTQKMKIREALRVVTDEEAAKLVNEEEIKLAAIQNVEQNGIVFLDEIDKVTARGEGMSGADVSRAGVQRDLLPLVEGTTVSTKYGMIHTDHILFIASGAFHLAKPSDLLPELQGRFPIRVELAALAVDDFVQILTNTDACLTRQYEALLATEGTHLEFTDDGIRRMAEIAFQVNEKTENIGARRLHTVIEKLLEEVSFDARSGSITIDAAYVDTRLEGIAQREDLARYIL